MANGLEGLTEGSSFIQNALTLNLIAAAVILIIGLIIGRFLSNLTRKILNELEVDVILKEKARIKLPITEFISSLVKYISYIIIIFVALNQLGLEKFVLNIILSILIIILIIFILFSLKDFIQNIFSGLFLHQKRNINPGEIIKINNIEGEVLSINLFEIKIKTRGNEIVYIPNSVLTKNIVIKKRRWI